MDSQSGEGFFTQLLQESDPNLPNDFVTTIPATKTTSEGASKNPPRGVNFTHEEYKILVNGWLGTSLDAIVGKDQKQTTFWRRIHQYYHECKKPNFQERTVHSLTNRWGTIQHSVNRFCGCLTQIENRPQSGQNEADKIVLAKASYKDIEKKEFAYEHCWEILRYHPKWILQKEEVKVKKRNHTSASPSIPDTINLGDEDISPMSHDLERPPGRKAKKDEEKNKRRKEERGTQLESAVSRIIDDKKQLHDEKMAKIDVLTELEKEKVKIMKQDQDEKIMLMDISELDVVQQEYIMKRRQQILQNM